MKNLKETKRQQNNKQKTKKKLQLVFYVFLKKIEFLQIVTDDYVLTSLTRICRHVQEGEGEGEESILSKAKNLKKSIKPQTFKKSIYRKMKKSF